MARAIHLTRAGLRRAAQSAPTFGFAHVLAVLLAFVAIRTHLAFHLPVTHLEGELIRALAATNGWDIAGWLRGLGLPASDIFGLRVPFLAVSLLTSLATYACVRQLTHASLAPALAVVWLNTCVLFGIGSLLATREAVAALGIAVAMWGLAAARDPARRLSWHIACLGAGLAVVAHPAAGWAFAALPLAILIDPACRNWLKKLGFYITIGIVGYVQWVGFSGLSTMIYPPNPLVVAGTVITGLGPGLVVLFALGLLSIAGRQRVAELGMPLAFVVGLLIATGVGAAKLTDLAMLMPVIAVVAALVASSAHGAMRNWIAEMTTPSAFLFMMFAVYLVSSPTNMFLPRLAPVNSLFGWQEVGQQIAKSADARRATYILTDDPNLTENLREFVPLPVLTGDPELAWLVPNCTSTGVFVSRTADANNLLGSFHQIARTDQAHRMAGAWVVDVLSVFSIARPTSKTGCGGG